MAVIREELILADRFSETFNKYIEAAKSSGEYTKEVANASRMAKTEASLLASALRVDAAQARAAEMSQRQLAAASKLAAAESNAAAAASRAKAASLNEAAAAARLEAAQARAAAAAQKEANQSMRQGASAASGLEGRLLSLAKAYVSLRSAQALISMTDTFTQTTARLERMNDGLQDTVELQDMIYQAAQRSRGAYQDTADMVAKLGTLAPDAFNSSGELVAFAEQINKQFALAGTSTQGAQAAMLQLTQAMSSGVLRGEELNSVLEQAPTITQAIARYLDVNIGQLREMASQGQITATVVKNAIFDAADRTDAAFKDIPLTFGQAWTMAGNAASRALQPAMQRLTDLLNSDLGRSAVNGLIASFELLGRVATGAIDLMANGAQWVADNWDLITSILAAVAGVATLLAARMAIAGAASVASALASAAAWAIANWPLVLMIGLAAAAGMAAQEMGLTFEDVFSVIGAGAGGLFAFGYNLVASAWNLLASFGEFFANFLDSPAKAAAHLLADLADFALSVLQNIAGAIDAVFGSNLAGAVNGWRSNVQDWANSVAGEKRVQIERMALLDIGETAGQWSSAAGGMGRALDNFSVGDVLGSFGQGGFDYSALMANAGVLEGIGADTSAIRRSVAMSEEDMKLLVDMAERQYVNNINLTAQTPVITINGQNTGDTEADLQWLEESLRKILVEQAASHTDMSYR